MRAVDERLELAHDAAARLRANIETVVIGKPDQIRLVLTALACRGHVLLEDVPGTAKTVLARALAGSIEGSVSTRIQCTPDLQPTDVTGLTVYDQREREFRFRAGPVFGNVLLVDEINRAMPKTQSALLEAMAEGQVTVDGVTHELPSPFFLLATENPIEQEGTFPLPEAQLDRFFLRTALGYPDLEQELSIVEGQLGGHPLDDLQPVVAETDVNALQEAVEEVYVDPLLRRWTVELVRATRSLDFVELGASVRGSLALERAARALALIEGRDHAEPEDVERLFVPVVLHRLVLTPEYLAEDEPTAEEVARRVWEAVLAAAPRPAPEWETARPAAVRKVS
ncbi:MAG: MoxR-like ATPase [Gaiellaceae bacterium]|jgi:MoxR-like ATPase|nr:MoxR-like ATPase [Gaiellaceae bacterium]